MISCRQLGLDSPSDGLIIVGHGCCCARMESDSFHWMLTELQNWPNDPAWGRRPACCPITQKMGTRARRISQHPSRILRDFPLCSVPDVSPQAHPEKSAKFSIRDLQTVVELGNFETTSGFSGTGRAMFRLGHNLIVLAAMAVFFTASRAEAGFVSTAASDSFTFDSTSSSSSSSPDFGESPSPSKDLYEQLQLGNAYAPTSSEGGMGSQSSSSSGGPSVASALSPSSPVPTAGGLAVRYSQQGEPFHPRFIKSRIFRPPRN